MAKITETQLRNVIQESLKQILKEGTTFPDAINKWEYIKETIGADQMLECIFQWSSSDQIDQYIEWFEEEEWVTFDNDEEEY